MHVLCIAAPLVSNKSANKKLMGNREKIVGAKGGEKKQGRKTAAQAPFKFKDYGSGPSSFSREARYSFTRP